MAALTKGKENKRRVNRWVLYGSFVLVALFFLLIYISIFYVIIFGLQFLAGWAAVKLANRINSNPTAAYLAGFVFSITGLFFYLIYYIVIVVVARQVRATNKMVRD